MATYKNLREAKAGNSRLLCSVPNCGKNRHGISKYCGRHKYQADSWGHPLARTPRPSELLADLPTVRRLIDLNQDHPGITYAVRFLDALLLTSAQGTSRAPAADRLASLHEAGITGRDLLERIATVYLCREGQRRIILDDTHFVTLVGHVVLRAAHLPDGPRLYGSLRRAVGRYLIDALGVLCVNLAKTAVQEELERNQALNLMSRPLTVSQ